MTTFIQYICANKQTSDITQQSEVLVWIDVIATIGFDWITLVYSKQQTLDVILQVIPGKVPQP